MNDAKGPTRHENPNCRFLRRQTVSTQSPRTRDQPTPATRRHFREQTNDDAESCSTNHPQLHQWSKMHANHRQNRCCIQKVLSLGLPFTLFSRLYIRNNQKHLLIIWSANRIDHRTKACQSNSVVARYLQFFVRKVRILECRSRFRMRNNHGCFRFQRHFEIVEWNNRRFVPRFSVSGYQNL